MFIPLEVIIVWFVVFISVCIMSIILGIKLKHTKVQLAQQREMLRLQTEILTSLDKEIRLIIYEINHYFLNPVFKRLRGLCNVKAPTWRNIWKNIKHMHHARSLVKDLQRLHEVDKVMYAVAESLEDELKKTVRKLAEMKT